MTSENMTDLEHRYQTFRHFFFLVWGEVHIGDIWVLPVIEVIVTRWVLESHTQLSCIYCVLRVILNMFENLPRTNLCADIIRHILFALISAYARQDPNTPIWVPLLTTLYYKAWYKRSCTSTSIIICMFVSRTRIATACFYWAHTVSLRGCHQSFSWRLIVHASWYSVMTQFSGFEAIL